MLLALSLAACSHTRAPRTIQLNIATYQHSLLDYVQGAPQDRAHLLESGSAVRECDTLVGRLRHEMPDFEFVRCDAYAAGSPTYAVAVQPGSKLVRILHAEASGNYEDIQRRAFHSLLAAICREEPDASSYVTLQFFTYSADSTAQKLSNYSPGRSDVRACTSIAPGASL